MLTLQLVAKKKRTTLLLLSIIKNRNLLTREKC